MLMLGQVQDTAPRAQVRRKEIRGGSRWVGIPGVETAGFFYSIQSRAIPHDGIR